MDQASTFDPYMTITSTVVSYRDTAWIRDSDCGHSQEIGKPIEPIFLSVLFADKKEVRFHFKDKLVQHRVSGSTSFEAALKKLHRRVILFFLEDKPSQKIPQLPDPTM